MKVYGALENAQLEWFTSGTLPAASSNPYRAVWVTDLGKIMVSDGTSWIAAGAGAGETNFITANDGSSTTGWATYADAAGTSPVDGTGGTATGITFATSASSPIIGTSSFTFAKDAANRQGSGVSYDFTIDAGYKAKVLNVSVEYMLSSGTFVAGTDSASSDVTIWIYDITNAVLIPLTNAKLYSNSTTLSSTFTGVFQTASNSTSYRLTLHVGSTSALAYTLKLDDVKVTPSKYVYGSPITDGQVFTPVINGSTTNVTLGTSSVQQGTWWRRGDSILCDVTIVLGTTPTAGSGNTQIPLPNGYVIDTAKLGTGARQIIGTGYCETSGAANNFPVQVVANTSNSNYVLVEVVTGTGTTLSAASAFTTAGNFLKIQFEAPIVGWGSSVAMSSDSDSRIISWTGSQASQVITANVTDIAFTSINDKTGSWNGTQFKVPSSGDYFVSGSIAHSVLGSTFRIYVNGTAFNNNYFANNYTGGAVAAGGFLLTNLSSGDLISLRSPTSGTATIGSLGVFKLSGNQTIAATESVNAKYYTSTTGSSTSSVPINFDTKVYDSHSAVTTGASWKFTAPRPGKYSVKVFLANASAVGSSSGVYVYKSGTIFDPIGYLISTNGVFNGADTVELLAGEYIDIRYGATYPWNGAASRTALNCSIEIESVGNY